jgi:hypothetical protein
MKTVRVVCTGETVRPQKYFVVYESKKTGRRIVDSVPFRKLTQAQKGMITDAR